MYVVGSSIRRRLRVSIVKTKTKTKKLSNVSKLYRTLTNTKTCRLHSSITAHRKFRLTKLYIFWESCNQIVTECPPYSKSIAPSYVSPRLIEKARKSDKNGRFFEAQLTFVMKRDKFSRSSEGTGNGGRLKNAE